MRRADRPDGLFSPSIDDMKQWRALTHVFWNMGSARGESVESLAAATTATAARCSEQPQCSTTITSGPKPSSSICKASTRLRNSSIPTENAPAGNECLIQNLSP